MNNLVKELLKGQEARKAELIQEMEKGFLVERESLAHKMISEVSESLTALGFEDLLVRNGAAVEIKKGKIVKVEKEIIKEVPVVTEDNEKAILIETINSKDAYIKELERLNAAMEYKIVELTNEKKLAEETLEETIKEMSTLEADKAAAENKLKAVEDKNKLLKKNNKTLLDTIADLEADAIEISPVSVETEETVAVEVEEKVEEKEVENKTNMGLVKLEAYKSDRRDDVSFYTNDSFYVMASNTCQEITVIPKDIRTEVTEEVVAEIQEELVKLGYRKEREVVSPITVNMNKGNLKGYFARTDARGGRMEFSEDDFFGGYIVDGTRAYLWSWDGKSDLCATYYLDKVIVGDKKKSVTEGTARMVAKQVKEMHKEYLEKVEALKASKENEIARNTAAANAKKAAMEAHNAMFEQGKEYNAPAPKEEVVETKTDIDTDINTDELSDTTLAYLNGF